MSFQENRAKLPDQPDLIVIITDQERATQHFPDNWEKDNLESMTRLKKNGFSFDRAFCNTCMCSPSRSTIFTGLYPAQHKVTQTLTYEGTFSNEQELEPEIYNIAEMLRNEGYDVQYRGKWHLNKGPDGTAKGLSPEILEEAGFLGWVAPDAGEDIKTENFGGGKADNDQKYVDQAIEYLQNVKTQRAEGGERKPFCLILSLVNPHDVLAYASEPQYGSDDYDSEDWANEDVGLPETWEEDLANNNKPGAQKQILDLMVDFLGELKDEEDKTTYIKFYAYLLKKIDKLMGLFIEELYRKDSANKSLADDTLVIRIADHGEMGLAHGGLRQKAFVAYEEAIRVPMIFSNPILFPDGPQSSQSLASLVDIMPTVASLLNVKAPSDELRGLDLSPVMESGEAVQDAILFTYDDIKAAASDYPKIIIGAGDRIQCVRTEEWKYTYYFSQDGRNKEYELYDLVNDPTEFNNLADSEDPAIKAKRLELEGKLQALIEKNLYE